jgi:hypothetical protein
MVGSQHLTEENVFHVATKPGQAHFACDNQHTCRECAHWLNQKGVRDRKGNLKPARCKKALLSTLDPTPEVPHSAWACRHFEANPTPPAI